MKRTQISRRPSKSKVEFDREYAAVLPEVLARGCEFNRYTEPLKNAVFFQVRPDPCAGPERGHHAKGRKAKDANDPANLRCLCDKHHRYVHGNGTWAREVGLMISRIS